VGGIADTRACRKAAEGPDALRNFVFRTRMIYGLNYFDYAPHDDQSAAGSATMPALTASGSKPVAIATNPRQVALALIGREPSGIAATTVRRPGSAARLSSTPYGPGPSNGAWWPLFAAPARGALERTAQHDEAFIDELIHELRMSVPIGLLFHGNSMVPSRPGRMDECEQLCI